MIGRQDELKLLLNQSDPAVLGRTLTYYGYFAQQRRAKIEAISSEQARLQRTVAEIEQQTQRIAESRGRREP